MIKHFILIAGITLGTSAQAATFNYDYQGQERTGSEFGFDQAFTGSLVLNEDLYPGGMIAGSQLELSHLATDVEDGGMTGPGSYTVTSSAGTFEGFFEGMDLPSFVGVGGIVHEAIFSTISGEGKFSWTFDEEALPIVWNSSGLYGGSNDFSITSNGDFVADDSSAGPGTWTRTEYNSAPAPVPLPAAGFLLMGALGALGLGRKLKAKT